MASHRRPKQPSRARVSVLTAAAATAVALSAQAGAHAAPAKPSKDEVKVQVDQLFTEQEQAAERYNGAKERTDQLRKQADQLQDQVARGQEQMTQLQGGLAAVAAQEYRDGGVDPSVALMLSSDPENYLSKASSVDQVNQTQSQTLKSLQDQQRRLDQQKVEAAETLAELDRNTKVLNDAKAEVQKKLAEAQKLLNQLSSADRNAVLGDRASRGGERIDVGSLPAVGGYAGVAVNAAMGKQGKPYVWGATGPNSFDCSGLVVWAYQQAGVSLPRTSQEQATVGTNVGKDYANAQPGDLVVYHSDAHHIGIYIGNGYVVHAPHTGDVVKIMKADAMPIKTIRRV
ncbi:cell wall-associated NlpC family hydrolase/FtsZ-binding cell division protein ZapB [Kitasatospora gansuensis]|uniref:Cell wall-associated NlpC family hydrolase/FtsZ-binding cell division protein ZapB n=1 Tax=Kitasatospora gansuensis TaxID=258050 RepID=A0A7W7SG99_9ACTN|nr:C40 family peptidase [Kitasatospora gansuensis]MBB4949940.1 cell wall-associated NlpC family hydrolase/FtsZ-binding cell division protein ZapB [Kitasatospora gansuensis]